MLGFWEHMGASERFEWFILQNTNETGTKYGRWRKSLLPLSLVLLCLSRPFCFMVLFYLLSFLFALHLSVDWVGGVEGEFGGQRGGLLSPISPVSFPFISQPPSFFKFFKIFLFLNIVGRHMQEREVWQMMPTCFSLGGKTIMGEVCMRGHCPAVTPSMLTLYTKTKSLPNTQIPS